MATGWHRIAVVTTLLATAATVRASTHPQPAQASATSGADDSISAAKRDFDAMKRTRTNAEPARSESSSNATDFSASPDEMSTVLPSQQPKGRNDPKPKARSEHWLIDTMNAQRGDADKTARIDALPSPLADESGRGDLIANAAAVAESSRTKAETAPSKHPATPDNPLNSFMASWMTPKDFDLLKVRNAEAGAPAVALAPSPDRAAEAANLTNLMRGEPSSAGGPSAVANAVAATPDPKPNPYATDFVVAAPTTTPGGLTEIPGAPTAAPTSLFAPTTPLGAPVASPQAEMAPPKMDTAAGDPLKPSTDSKYFPQLKRF